MESVEVVRGVHWSLREKKSPQFPNHSSLLSSTSLTSFFVLLLFSLLLKLFQLPSPSLSPLTSSPLSPSFLTSLLFPPFQLAKIQNGTPFLVWGGVVCELATSYAARLAATVAVATTAAAPCSRRLCLQPIPFTAPTKHVAVAPFPTVLHSYRCCCLTGWREREETE